MQTIKPGSGQGRKGRRRGRVLEAPDLRDLLGAVSDRADLERLFLRHVSLSDILRLAGRNVDPARITALLESRHLANDLRRLLDS